MAKHGLSFGCIGIFDPCSFCILHLISCSSNLGVPLILVLYFLNNSFWMCVLDNHESLKSIARRLNKDRKTSTITGFTLLLCISCTPPPQSMALARITYIHSCQFNQRGVPHVPGTPGRHGADSYTQFGPPYSDIEAASFTDPSHSRHLYTESETSHSFWYSGARSKCPTVLFSSGGFWSCAITIK